MPNGGNISKHVNEFTELAEMGIVVHEELLVIMLLSSLPSVFEHFFVAMETRDNLTSLPTVKQKILEESTINVCTKHFRSLPFIKCNTELYS